MSTVNTALRVSQIEEVLVLEEVEVFDVDWFDVLFHQLAKLKLNNEELRLCLLFVNGLFEFTSDDRMPPPITLLDLLEWRVVFFLISELFNSNFPTIWAVAHKMFSWLGNKCCLKFLLSLLAVLSWTAKLEAVGKLTVDALRVWGCLLGNEGERLGEFTIKNDKN